ncbi:MAG: pilus assembly protein [Chloroflexi bacterium]|nr:MAG: pilus assembly protein [Chloroflexota bacterium]
MRRIAHQRRHDRGAGDVSPHLDHELRAHRRRRGGLHRDVDRPRRAAAMRRFVRRDDGQSLIELALILPAVMIFLIFGLVELGTLLSDDMTMASASREGARLGGALVNGGGTLGCSAGQSPNASTVDMNIVAAVERVLTGNGTRIKLSPAQRRTDRRRSAARLRAAESALAAVRAEQRHAGRLHRCDRRVHVSRADAAPLLHAVLQHDRDRRPHRDGAQCLALGCSTTAGRPSSCSR